MPRRLFLQFDSLKLLLGLNISLFILPTILSYFVLRDVTGSYGFFLDLLGGLIPAKVQAGEAWRMIASTFLHADLLHIAANIFSLYFIGSIVQSYYGQKLLFAFYVLAGLGGSIFSVVFLPDTPTVGASGAVFGLVGVLLAGSLRRNRYGAELPFRFVDIAPIAIYAFAVGLIPGFAVNNWAHLGGFLTGCLLGLGLRNKSGGYSRAEKVWVQLCFAIAVVLFVVAYAGLGLFIYRALWV